MSLKRVSPLVTERHVACACRRCFSAWVAARVAPVTHADACSCHAIVKDIFTITKTVRCACSCRLDILLASTLSCSATPPRQVCKSDVLPPHTVWMCINDTRWAHECGSSCILACCDTAQLAPRERFRACVAKQCAAVGRCSSALLGTASACANEASSPSQHWRCLHCMHSSLLRLLLLARWARLAVTRCRRCVCFYCWPCGLPSCVRVSCVSAGCRVLQWRMPCVVRTATAHTLLAA
jgi:hypothetical protein